MFLHPEMWTGGAVLKKHVGFARLVQDQPAGVGDGVGALARSFVILAKTSSITTGETPATLPAP